MLVHSGRAIGGGVGQWPPVAWVEFRHPTNIGGGVGKHPVHVSAQSAPLLRR